MRDFVANGTMVDNPNVSMNDLFADIREGLKKYNSRQKLAKERRQQRRNEQRRGAGPSSDDGPLFGSQLVTSPRHQSTASAVEDDEGCSSLTPARIPSCSLDAQTGSGPSQAQAEPATKKKPPLFFSLLKNNGRTSPSSPSSSLWGSKPKTSPSDFSLLSSTSSKPKPDDAPSNSRQDDDIPEYVPLCELRRRREAEALIRLRAAQAQAPKFKPLTFSKPSFTFRERGESPSSSSDAQGGSRKRKSDDVEGEEPAKTTAGYYRSPNAIAATPRPLSGAVSLSTSAAASLPPGPSTGSTSGGLLGSSSPGELRSSSSIYSYGNFPQNRRQWTKDELDGLMNFANKYIVPGAKRRKMG